ncbi:MAG: homoserine kinase [Proteobacteria bacterium]|nr:homoserine kinase [Pseudomonadota bacterium]
MRNSATAFAPASVGNVGIGFDILGHTVEAIGDRVRVERTVERGVRIRAITGVATELPLEASRNTAGQALKSLAEAHNLDFGFEMTIEKGIPLGSGLGGSAASAVAAVVAGNALLEIPLSKLELLKFAMKGEAVASGSVHVDNIAPSLFGGLVLTVGVDHPRTKQIPVPPGIRCVLVHPHMYLSTKEARGILSSTVKLSDLVWQCANLAGFISASNGALGCSISGAGPTVFCWCETPAAEKIQAAMIAAFGENGLACDSWISSIEATGARVID